MTWSSIGSIAVRWTLQYDCTVLLSRSNMRVRSYGPGLRFRVCVHSYLDLWDITFVQGHSTPSDHWQWMCEILSRSNMAVRSYDLDKALGCVCTLTLNLEIWPWVKVMTNPWVIDKDCVKYYPDPTWRWGVMAWTLISDICALWPWPRRYDIGSRSWLTLGS